MRYRVPMVKTVVTNTLLVCLYAFFVAALAFLAWLSHSLVNASEALVAIVLAGVVALLLVIERFTVASRRTTRGVLVAVMVLVLGASVYLRGHRNGAEFLRGDYISSWNVYHYYMGSKYFRELGYFDLYKYTFLADREMDNRLQRQETTRDLHDYSYVKVKDELASIEHNPFTPQRWAAFKHDLHTIFDMTPQRTSEQMVGDLGYNATPFGHFVFSTLSHTFPIDTSWGRFFALGLDWLVLIPTFILVCHAFGWLRGLALLTCFMLFFAVARFHFGALFRFHWLAASLAGIALYRLGHMRAAGVAFGIAVAERIFPVLFLAGPALHTAILWVRHRRLDKPRVRFGVGFLGTLAVTMVLSCSVGRGVNNWPQFVENMSNHSSYQYAVAMKFGLKRVFAHDFSREKKQPAKPGRRKTFKRQKTAYWVALAALLACAGFILASCDERDSLLVGVILAFLLSVMSRYYWSLWFVLLLAGPTLFRQRYKRAIFDAAVVGLIPFYYLVSLGVKYKMERYTAANVYVIGCVVLLTVMLATDRLGGRLFRSLRREPY